MKKFEEEFDKNIDVFHAIGCHNGMCCSVKEVKVFGKDWVSPEDHQAEIDKRKQQYEEHQEIYSKTAKKLNETELELSKLKSQLEKQQPEIPKFVANEIEEKNRRFSNFHKTANIESYVKEVRDWYYEKPYHAELFYRAILDGYTVEPPKALVSPCPVCGYEEVESNFCSICGRKNDYE